ncbi:MAG: NUDIX domain-containing protein [Propionibacteriaceae bacterium]|nr:NUDIX domain-containing protein [Propionibacteriaceae bacterium]
MPVPEFIVQLRDKVGHSPLWLSGASAVVIREHPERGTEVLLVKGAETGRWSPVAGVVEPGEHPKVTVIREVLEETGVTATIERLCWLTVSEMITYANGDESRYIEHVFRCRWIAGEPAPGDDENTEARFFPVDALPEMTARHRQAVAIALRDDPTASLDDVDEDFGGGLIAESAPCEDEEEALDFVDRLSMRTLSDEAP